MAFWLKTFCLLLQPATLIIGIFLQFQISIASFNDTVYCTIAWSKITLERVSNCRNTVTLETNLLQKFDISDGILSPDFLSTVVAGNTFNWHFPTISNCRCKLQRHGVLHNRLGNDNFRKSWNCLNTGNIRNYFASKI